MDVGSPAPPIRQLRIGITGQGGFIGSILAARVRTLPDAFTLIPFERRLFASAPELRLWVESCDVVVHLAGVNRHHDLAALYDMNIATSRALATAVEQAAVPPHVIFASSIQEASENPYGRSKREGRNILEQAAHHSGTSFTGMLIPNVFGPFGRPQYNSVIATFCHQLCHASEPMIEGDATLRLIYVDRVVSAILAAARNGGFQAHVELAPCGIRSVSEMLTQLRGYVGTYLEKGIIPDLGSPFDLNLFNTFRSYMDASSYFPRAFRSNVDSRGAFVELVRAASGGQFSYSVTHPAITRGNHYHTRKVERFMVLAGKAVVRLRRVIGGPSIDFFLDGASPSYVDIPIWCTHSISNVGEAELLTAFWVNEPFDPNDSDTFVEVV